jgi:acetyl-CoA carboxylase biotin carboxyl carrier protein
MSEPFDLNTVESLLTLMRDKGAVELELEQGGARLRLRLAEGRPVAAAPVYAEAAPAVSAAPAARPATALAPGHVISSPMVGTFYRAPRPDAPPFVEVGDRVRKGQPVCIIEAMKLFNEIECDVEGVIAEVFAEAAQPVQFGQPLFRVVPA